MKRLRHSPIAKERLGPVHPLVARILDRYAAALQQRNRKAEAKPSEIRAKAILAHHALTVDLSELTALRENELHAFLLASSFLSARITCRRASLRFRCRPNLDLSPLFADMGPA